MSDITTMAESQRTKSLAWCLVGMCCWNFIVAIDSTALSVALPTIAHDIRANSTQAFWCGTSFVLCSAACQPVLASFSSAFGRRPLLLLSLLLFTAGAIICGVAQHVSILILGRSIQGCGGGGLLTLTYVLMADELTLHERHKAISLISLTWLVGTVVGPIMSGGFTQSVSWRWIFWINLPFCAISLIVVAFLLKSTYKPPHGHLQAIKHIDWIGSVLFVASITSFLIAISWGGTMYAWSSWHTLVPLILGLAGLSAWIAYSTWMTEEPMIPLRIMKNRTAAISYAGNLIQGLAQFGMLYYLPLYYQAVLGFSPTMSGVALLPQCLVAGVFSAITGILISRHNTVRPFVLSGWSIYTLGLGLLTLLRPTTTTPHWILINIPSGIGLGALFSGLALATQAAAETTNTHSVVEIAKIKAMAAGLNPFFRTLGQALGIVIAQAAFTNQLSQRLGSGAAIDAASLGQQIALLPHASPERTELVNAFNDSLRVVWWVLFALAATMLLVTLFTKDIGIKPKGSLPSVSQSPLLLSMKSANTLSTRASNLSLKPRSSGTRSPRTVSSMQSLARMSAAASTDMLDTHAHGHAHAHATNNATTTTTEGRTSTGSGLGLGMGMMSLPHALGLSRESLGFTRPGARESTVMAAVAEGAVGVPEMRVRREIS